ncbi:MAG: hypothetical protein K0Q84_1234 [Arthrobacter sp.]|nr:hypothetical protein [Arthrobacter sp.]
MLGEAVLAVAAAADCRTGELEVDTQLRYVHVCTLRKFLPGGVEGCKFTPTSQLGHRKSATWMVHPVATAVTAGGDGAASVRQLEEKIMNRTKKVALSLGAAAVALCAGLGATGMASATTAPPAPNSSSPSANAAPDGQTPGSGQDKGQGKGHGLGHGLGLGHGRGHGQGLRGAQPSALAAKLGVDEAKVADALKNFRQENRPSGPRSGGQKPDRAAKDAALAASLAKSLGIDEAKVKAALEELRAEARKSRAADLKPRLDQAVADGTLTRAEADAVMKAVEQGVISGRH